MDNLRSTLGGGDIASTIKLFIYKNRNLFLFCKNTFEERLQWEILEEKNPALRTDWSKNSCREGRRFTSEMPNKKQIKTKNKRGKYFMLIIIRGNIKLNIDRRTVSANNIASTLILFTFPDVYPIHPR